MYVTNWLSAIRDTPTWKNILLIKKCVEKGIVQQM